MENVAGEQAFSVQIFCSWLSKKISNHGKNYLIL